MFEPTESELYSFTRTEESAISFGQEIGLLPVRKVCCDKELLLQQRIHGKNKSFVFRCNKKICRKEYSLKKQHFLKNLICQYQQF
jgi:hypothetical protein